MASCNNGAVCSPSTETITSPSSLHAPLPTLPFDLIPEILCRLPVKLLLQLKSVCKSWKSLISNPKFSRKHLHMSTACHDHHHLILPSTNTSSDWLLWDSPISSIFSTVSSTSIPQLLLRYPEETTLYNDVYSCDGILLFDNHCSSPLLWNPSIRKFKILPPFLKPSRGKLIQSTYTLGYDHLIDNYKIFVVSSYQNEVNLLQWKNEVSVYTLRYDSWRRIDDIPCDGLIYEEGIFVSGTVNWLAFHASGSSSLPVLVSLDLEKESYRKQLLTHDLKKSGSNLGVLRDCLCIFTYTNRDEILDVWIMKEYGIKESWTKLFSVPYVGGSPRVVYVSEDKLLLLDRKTWKLFGYNSRNGTFKIPKIQNINLWMMPKVYVESLISPFS